MIRQTDESYSLTDSSLNDQMCKGLNEILADYVYAWGNLSTMDLAELKKKIPG